VDNDFRKAWAATQAERDKEISELRDRMKDASPKERAEAEHELQQKWAAKVPRPPFSVIIDHIDHIAKVAGIDHVGLGSDFDGIPQAPQGMDSAADLPKITEELVKRGYNEEQIHKILGGNLVRVFKAVETVSKKIQQEEPTLEGDPTHSANVKDQPK
jgi:membrane dipeptidase